MFVRASIKNKGTTSCTVKVRLNREQVATVRRYFNQPNNLIHFAQSALYSQGGGWYEIIGDFEHVDAALHGLYSIRRALALRVKPALGEALVRYPTGARIKVKYNLDSKGHKIPVLVCYKKMARDFVEREVAAQIERQKSVERQRANMHNAVSALSSHFGKEVRCA